jgi:hypothetical protein
LKSLLLPLMWLPLILCCSCRVTYLELWRCHEPAAVEAMRLFYEAAHLLNLQQQQQRSSRSKETLQLLSLHMNAAVPWLHYCLMQLLILSFLTADCVSD